MHRPTVAAIALWALLAPMFAATPARGEDRAPMLGVPPARGEDRAPIEDNSFLVEEAYNQ